MKIEIESLWHGRLLRDYLQEKLQLSARTIAKLKRIENGMLLNDKKVTVRAVLSCSDTLLLRLEDIDFSPSFPPTPIPLSILYEDEHILAVNKAQGMPCHPSKGHYTDTLANAVLARYQDSPFVFRAINRLDSDTGGVVLIAKNRMVASLLGTQMQNRQIQKKYIAILQGHMQEDIGTISDPICRNPNSAILRQVCKKTEAGAQACLTQYQTVWKCDTRSGVIAVPHTGRTHQLRVHFSAHGAPILYDPFYGTEQKGKPLCLHAWKLEFVHPIQKIPITITASMSKEMQNIWKEGIASCAKEIK